MNPSEKIALLTHIKEATIEFARINNYGEFSKDLKITTPEGIPLSPQAEKIYNFIIKEYSFEPKNALLGLASLLIGENLPSTGSNKDEDPNGKGTATSFPLAAFVPLMNKGSHDYPMGEVSVFKDVPSDRMWVPNKQPNNAKAYKHEKDTGRVRIGNYMDSWKQSLRPASAVEIASLSDDILETIWAENYPTILKKQPHFKSSPKDMWV